MKTLQIQNTRELFFNNDKQRYLDFRNAWKTFINEGKAKKVEKTTWSGDKYYESELQALHHLFYVLMIGKDATKGFTEESREHYYGSFQTALSTIKHMKSADKLSYLLPLSNIFGETLTQQMFDSLKHELSKLS